MMNNKDLSSIIPLSKTNSAADVPNESVLDSLNSHGSRKIILRKPNLESILGGSTGKVGVTPELISMRKQLFQKQQQQQPNNPVSLQGSPGRVYVRSNSIDSTSAIKILSTSKKNFGKSPQLTLPIVTPTSDLKDQLIMRRTLSGDNVEAPRSDKENPKISNRSGKTIITIGQMEKEKASLQQQLSELVRNAESKRAEIASLKMEVNRLKESSSPTIDATVTSLRNEVDQLRQENRGLRERLDEFERSGPIGIQGSMNAVGEAASPKKGPHSLPDHMLGVDSSTGFEKSRSCEWDKTSSTSISEVSVACLQDRISQMEETHYSTNEELQATLQELSDLQDQVNLLQMETEQLENEKAVLYESLCSQTERLEDARSQVYKLKAMLFQEAEAKTSSSPDTEKTQQEYLVELLKSAQVEYDELAAKKEELFTSANESRVKMIEIEGELESALVNMKTLETKITRLTDEKRQTEISLSDSEKTVSALRIEVSAVKTQLEREQAKVTELLRDRDAHATSELDILLLEARQGKDKIAAEAVKLQEQLALSQLESSKLLEKVRQLEQDLFNFKRESETALIEVQSKLKNETLQKERLIKEVQNLEALVRDTEVKCHRHLEDKRELKASLNDLQKQLNDEKSRATDVQKELQDVKSKMNQREEEWKNFQEDLLTTVRVANDFKTEAQEHMERIILKNKKLSDKIPELEAEIARLKTQSLLEVTSPSVTDSSMGPPVAVVPPVTPRRSMSVTPVCYSPTRGTIRSVSLDPVSNPLVTPRASITKWVDLRTSSKMSVRTLIESLEPSNKKTGKASPSESKSPTSQHGSLNSTGASPSMFSTPEANISNLIRVTPDVKPLVQSSEKSLREQTGSSTPKSPLTSLSAKKLDSIRRSNIG